MQTITLISYAIGGAITLYLGAQLLITYASKLALAFGMSKVIVGLTVVAFTTSTPELASVIIAHINGGLSDVVIGSIIGSNISNIGLILGLVCLIKPLSINKQVTKFEMPITLVVTAIFWGMLFYGVITRLMGAVLFLGIILYVLKHVHSVKRDLKSRKEKPPRIEAKKKWGYFFFIALGMGLLSLGGWLLIESAVSISRRFGLSERVIGLTVVALGTSLPEFAASIVAIFKKLGDVAIGNIIGSNLFNILFILGVVAMIAPVNAERIFITRDMPLLMGFTALLWLLTLLQKKLSRLSGLILFLSYVGYFFWISQRYN